MRLHLFNPENDLALAAATSNFTPPKSVDRFRTALAALPAWIADPGDNIVAPEVDSSWFKTKGLDVATEAAGIPTPWGWSAYAVGRFRRIGIDGPFPDVDRIRALSHRRSALELRRALEERLSYPLPPEPLEITDVSQLPDSDMIILKSPWSCSGRGIVDCQGLSKTTIRRRADESIRRQGSVMVEAKLRKVLDFAMLFENGCNVGLSLFFTNGAAYSGNIVGSRRELASMIGIDGLDETAAAVEACLPADYRGPLGVDMMVYETSDGTRRICPTIEINFRRTMGFVALALNDRFGAGRFVVTAGSVPVKPGAISLIPDNPYFSAIFTPR